MPTPVSRDGQRRRARLATPATRVIEPLNVNLNAFDSRLRTIFSHMSRSTNTGSGSGGQSTIEIAAPHAPIADRNALARSAVTRARSVGSNDARDAAGLDPREIEQRVHQLQQTLRIAMDRCRDRRPAARRPASRRLPRSGPSSSVSGVRNSWLTLLKNAVFARSMRRQRLGALSFVFVARGHWRARCRTDRRPGRGSSGTDRRTAAAD